MDRYGRRHRRRDGDGDEGPGSKFKKEQLDGHQNSREGRHEGRRHSAGSARSQQDPAPVRSQLHHLREDRSERRSGLYDGTFRSERPTRPDGESRGQRLQNPNPHPNQALSNQHRFHSFGNAVAFQGRLPEMDHDAHQEAADGRYKNDQGSKVMVNRISNGKRPLTVEKQIRKQVYEFKQPLCHEPGDKAYEGGKNGSNCHGRFEGFAKFLEPYSSTAGLGLGSRHGI